MVRLILASRAAVFALLDRTAFGRDEKELSVYEGQSETGQGRD
jgi:hypothetical protein